MLFCSFTACKILIFSSEKLLVSPDPALYHFVNQGSLTVDNVDDKEEIQFTDVRSRDQRFK